MYSGTTFRNKSGHIIGVHQRIDVVASRLVIKHFGDDVKFPSRRQILKFEGNNGPDGIKRKSPSKDEPWHFVDPTDENDVQIYEHIDNHYSNLVEALKSDNVTRASFEAAWLSHAVTDALTPAHHYPLAKKINELWGKPKEERTSAFAKNVIIGNGAKDSIKKNWQYWGAKGVFSTHVLFELGVASAIRTSRFQSLSINADEIRQAQKQGIDKFTRQQVQAVYDLDLYHKFWKDGWTNQLAKQSRQVLLPTIIKTVAILWAMAIMEAEA